MFLVKILKFLHPFFLGQIGKEKMFGGVLGRKVAVLVYKNIDLKNSKNCYFFFQRVKCIVFVQILKFLHFLGQIGQEKLLVSITVVHRKLSRTLHSLPIVL